jgi:hypothetical protein
MTLVSDEGGGEETDAIERMTYITVRTYLIAVNTIIHTIR